MKRLEIIGLYEFVPDRTSWALTILGDGLEDDEGSTWRSTTMDDE
jgi:hypothetical protein